MRPDGGLAASGSRAIVRGAERVAVDEAEAVAGDDDVAGLHRAVAGPVGAFHVQDVDARGQGEGVALRGLRGRGCRPLHDLGDLDAEGGQAGDQAAAVLLRVGSPNSAGSYEVASWTGLPSPRKT